MATITSMLKNLTDAERELALIKSRPDATAREREAAIDARNWYHGQIMFAYKAMEHARENARAELAELRVELSRLQAELRQLRAAAQAPAHRPGPFART